VNPLRRIFRVRYPYSSESDQRRAIILLVMSLVGIAASVLTLTLFAARVIGDLSESGPMVLFIIVYAIIALTATYLLIQSGRLALAIGLFVFTLLINTSVVVLSLTSSPLVLVIPLVAGGALAGRRTFVAIIVLILAVVVARGVIQASLPRTQFTRLSEAAVGNTAEALAALGFGALFIMAFAGSAERAAFMARRGSQRLRVIGGASNRFATAENETELYYRLLSIIQNELSYTLAQLLFVDANGAISRRIRLGIGEGQLATATTASAGDVAVAAAVLRERVPVRVSSDDPPPRNVHVLVPSRNAVVLPVVFGGAVQAVLSVQSDQSSAMTDEEIAALALMAEGFALTLERLRNMEDLTRTVNEQEQMIARARTQLAEYQGRARQTVAQGWNNYTSARGGLFGYDFQNGAFQPASSMPESMRIALAQGDVLVDRQPDGATLLNVPILLRDEVLGAMAFVLPAGQAVTDRQLDLARTVSGRLGVALENMRLFEQSQSLAARERKASEIAAQLLSANDIDALMERAADTFNDALGAIRTRVVLQPEAFSENRPAVRRGDEPPAGSAANGYHAPPRLSGATMPDEPPAARNG
jgi:GAF domain-containing protein